MPISDEVRAKLASTQAVVPSPEDVAARLATEREPDPLADVDYPDDLAGDSKAELDALGKAFVARRGQEDRRYRQTVDSEYWFCVAFRCKEDKQKFLTEVGVDLREDKYVNGYDLARLLGLAGTGNNPPLSP